MGDHFLIKKPGCSHEAFAHELQELGISRERVRQIEVEALEHLRRPTQAEMLKGFLDDAAVPERTPRPQKGERKRTSRKSRSRRLRVQELRAGTA